MPAAATPDALVLEDDDIALYTAPDLGLEPDAFVYTEVDPQLVNIDRLHYQRRLDEGRAEELVHGSRKKLRKHVGLIAERPDNTLWVVDGQHHTEAGVVAGVALMRFYKFASTGWQLEKDVFDRLTDWRQRQGGADHIAPYVRASFANGWAEAGDGALPLPAHAAAQLREAVSWAAENAHRPGVLEVVRRDGRLAGLQTALDRRRDQLETRWDGKLRDVLRQVGRLIAPAIARRVTAAREDDDQPTSVDQQSITDAIDAALSSIADGTVVTEWRRTAG
ncbi:MAG TPA: hypothetical protein VFO60_01870, partial [Candidatus Dormibacteraeota bacterium]|nr:hypothetical protein [Candidatus Dormibacteraeota bacterium]